MIYLLLSIAYILSVFATRKIMLEYKRKHKIYISDIIYWLMPVVNILFTILTIIDNTDISKSKLYKWFINEK